MKVSFSNFLPSIKPGANQRVHQRGSAQDRAAGRRRDALYKAGAKPGRGYSYLHHAVDDHSRLVYSEILGDERKDTAAGFWTRARAFFAGGGFTVKQVMTDNGGCYRSHVFADALGDGIGHKFTRPYRPQTNGKVERFNRTLMQEWAYVRAYDSEKARQAAYAGFIHDYNCNRAHTAIGGLTPPATRSQRHGEVQLAWETGMSPPPLFGGKTMTRIAIIVGSTRPNRLAPQVAEWVHEHAQQHGGAEFELVDIARPEPAPAG